MFIGPRIIASHDQISGEFAAEFPVLMNTTAFQAGAGLSVAREYRRKLVKIWRTTLLVYRELDVVCR